MKFDSTLNQSNRENQYESDQQQMQIVSIKRDYQQKALLMRSLKPSQRFRSDAKLKVEIIAGIISSH
jgi:hypothetical protein